MVIKHNSLLYVRVQFVASQVGLRDAIAHCIMSRTELVDCSDPLWYLQRRELVWILWGVVLASLLSYGSEHLQFYFLGWSARCCRVVWFRMLVQTPWRTRGSKDQFYSTNVSCGVLTLLKISSGVSFSSTSNCSD